MDKNINTENEKMDKKESPANAEKSETQGLPGLEKKTQGEKDSVKIEVCTLSLHNKNY